MRYTMITMVRTPRSKYKLKPGGMNEAPHCEAAKRVEMIYGGLLTKSKSKVQNSYIIKIIICHTYLERQCDGERETDRQTERLLPHH